MKQGNRERTSQIQKENIVCFLLYVELRFKYITAIIYIINSVQTDRQKHKEIKEEKMKGKTQPEGQKGGNKKG